MKTKQFYAWTCTVAVAAAVVAAVLAGVPKADAQVGTQPTYQNPVTQPNQPTQYQQRQDATPLMDRSMSAKQACKASDIIGLDVRPKSGDNNIGEIKDLMISHDGRVEYAAVSFGGFLGVGDKLFAVPLDAIEFEKAGARDAPETFARIDVTEETLRNKQGFDESNWPERADSSFLARGGSRRQAERPASPLGGSPQ